MRLQIGVLRYLIREIKNCANNFREGSVQEQTKPTELLSFEIQIFDKC